MRVHPTTQHGGRYAYLRITRTESQRPSIHQLYCFFSPPFSRLCKNVILALSIWQEDLSVVISLSLITILTDQPSGLDKIEGKKGEVEVKLEGESQGESEWGDWKQGNVSCPPSISLQILLIFSLVNLALSKTQSVTLLLPPSLISHQTLFQDRSVWLPLSVFFLFVAVCLSDSLIHSGITPPSEVAWIFCRPWKEEDSSGRHRGSLSFTCGTESQ